jgi:Na+-driven multidrug efflux pump
MGRTRPAAVFNFIGYWVLALPLAYWLVIENDVGLPGIWWSLALGLFVVAVLLVTWIAKRGPGTLPPGPSPRGAF